MRGVPNEPNDLGMGPFWNRLIPVAAGLFVVSAPTLWFGSGDLRNTAEVGYTAALALMATYFLGEMITPDAWERSAAGSAQLRQRLGTLSWLHPQWMQTRKMGWVMVALMGVATLERVPGLLDR